MGIEQGQETAGRLEEALQTNIEARKHFEQVLGSEHPRVALVSNNEGEVLNLLGRYAEAGVAYERAVRLDRQSGVNTDDSRQRGTSRTFATSRPRRWAMK